jgi:hypothetical protein
MTDETRETQPTQAQSGSQQSEEQARAQPETPLAAFFFHQRRAAEQTFEALKALIPPEFRCHSREATKEFLTSFKVLIEGANEAVSRELNKIRKPPEQQSGEGSDSGTSTTGKTKVKVEVI